MFTDGQYLIEVDRILRPGGYWVLSGPPINWQSHWKGWQRTKSDLNADQNAIEAVTTSLCWKKLKQKGDIAIWQKPLNHNHCRKTPKFCSPENNNPDKSWYTKLQTCITPLPNEIDGGGVKLKKWPERLTTVPPRIQSGTLEGITSETFSRDYHLWKKRVGYYKTVVRQLGSGRYRNILDMNSYLGGLAANLAHNPVWVMNIVPTVGIDTLGVIYERGLIGTYQDWCEAMSTYPRTYDFIHAGNVFGLYKDR